jgi:hypothetical protein
MACFRSKDGTEAELKLASICLPHGLDQNLVLVNLEQVIRWGKETMLRIAMKAMRN